MSDVLNSAELTSDVKLNTIKEIGSMVGGELTMTPIGANSDNIDRPNGETLEESLLDMVNRMARMNECVTVTLTANGWIAGSNGTFTQRVNTNRIDSSMNPILTYMLPDNATADTKEKYGTAFGIIASGSAITEDGSVLFKVYEKPVTDCTVGLKGV